MAEISALPFVLIALAVWAVLFAVYVGKYIRELRYERERQRGWVERLRRTQSAANNERDE